MTTIIIFGLLVHWFADFVLQTHEQAEGKSRSNRLLTDHVTTYSFIWFLFMVCCGKTLAVCILFAMITFYVHWTIDFCSSRIVKRFWEKKDFHNAFVIIGLDQILHYLQLYFTFKLIS